MHRSEFKVEFTTRNGETKYGNIIRTYVAFEGGRRYIFKCEDGREYRCVFRNDKYVEYVV